MIPTFSVQATVCPKCNHQHAGPEIGFICVGCPCPERPELQGDDIVEESSTPVNKLAVISVPTRVLEAVAKWAGTDETRPHLHQVLFSKGVMVAVDGHRMVIVPCETFGLTVGVDREYLLAAVAAQRVMKIEQPQVITIEPTEDPMFVRLGLVPTSRGRSSERDAARAEVAKRTAPGLIVRAAASEKFPPYEQVVRDSEKKTPFAGPEGYGFNLRYIDAIAEVDAATCDADNVPAQSRGVKIISWSSDRLGPMVFVNEAGVKFLIMPMRI
jgi:hypothetical protein